MPETIPHWILTYALHSTLLCLAVLGLAHRIRRADHRTLALRMALFGALLSSTLPFQWTPTIAGSAATVAGGPQTAALPLDAAVVGTAFRTAAETAPPRNAVSAQATDGATPVALDILRAHWPSLVIALLLAVSTVRLLQLERARRRFLRGLERVTLNDSESRSKLDAWADSEGRAPIRLSQSPRATSPLAISANEICVPAGGWEELSPAEREAALAHEFAHLERRDPLWFALAAAMERLFWFLPLHGVLRRRAAMAAEVACDAAAAQRVGSALAVARSLMAVAAKGSASARGHRVPVLIPAMATTQSDLVARVESLLRRVDLAGAHPTSPVGAKRFYVGVALAALAFACGAPNVGNESPRSEAAGSPAAPDTEMLVIDLHPDGSATLHAPGDRETEASLKNREGRAALGAWLKDATADAPRGGPDSLDAGNAVHRMATSMPLLLRADKATPMKYTQWAMEQCASPDVQLWDIRLQSQATPGLTVHIPLPVDVGIAAASDAAPQHRIDIRIDPAADGIGRKYTLSLGTHVGGPMAVAVEEEIEEGEVAEDKPVPSTLPGPTAVHTLAEVRASIQSLGERYDLVVSTIDPRKGTTVDDVQPVLDLLLEAEIQSITFLGSYER